MTENDLGLKLLSEGHIADAVTHLRSAAWINPSYKSYLNLAVALRHAGLFDDALEYLYKCVKLDDLEMNAWLAFANTYTDMGVWKEAIFAYEAAFFRVSKPGTPITHVQQVTIGYAQALLRDHQFQAAWPLFELGRFERSYWALPGTKRWLGEPCDTLLVVCEGGFGDAILFGRWLSFAKTRAKTVKLIVWDSMAKFRDWQALGVDEVLTKSSPISPAGIQYTTSWMSLPGIAGMKSVENIPIDCMPGSWNGFEVAREYAEGLNRVGFCWHAEEAGTLRKIRTLPTDDAEVLAHLLSEHGQVISLCPQNKALYRPDIGRWPENVVQDETMIAGWAVTASTIRSCKFVVTVDTVIAHLAGLCGVPTLLLLPCSSAWPWGTEANTPSDPWYGDHVKYFRNKDPLKWQMEQVAEAVSLVSS